MKVVWSRDAISDLDRFAAFLQQRHPSLASMVGESLIEAAQTLSEHPQLGRPIGGHPLYRQIMMRALNAGYAVQYRIDREPIVVLRVFQGRERH